MCDFLLVFPPVVIVSVWYRAGKLVDVSACGRNLLSVCPVIVLWLLQAYVTYYLSADIFFL
jgi:hypothetical protein